jgi:hypothetical protein
VRIHVQQFPAAVAKDELVGEPGREHEIVKTVECRFFERRREEEYRYLVTFPPSSLSTPAYQDTNMYPSVGSEGQEINRLGVQPEPKLSLQSQKLTGVQSPLE